MKRSIGRWLRTIGTWLLIIVGAFPMFMIGLEKFRGPLWQRMFQRWGYPDDFYLVVGAVEMAAALALLVPRTRRVASFTLLVVMAGAFVTHVVYREARFTSPLVFMVVYSAIAFIDWRRRRSADGTKGPSTPEGGPSHASVTVGSRSPAPGGLNHQA